MKFKYKDISYQQVTEGWRQDLSIDDVKQLYMPFLPRDSDFKSHSSIMINNPKLEKYFSRQHKGGIDYLSKRVNRSVDSDLRFYWTERIRVLYAAVSYALTELEHYFSVKNLESPVVNRDLINTARYGNNLIAISLIDLIVKYDQLLFLSEKLKRENKVKLNVIKYLNKELDILLRFPGYAFTSPNHVKIYPKNIGSVFIWLLQAISLDLCSDDDAHLALGMSKDTECLMTMKKHLRLPGSFEMGRKR